MNFKKKILLRLIENTKFTFFDDVSYIKTEYFYLQHETGLVKYFSMIFGKVGVKF